MTNKIKKMKTLENITNITKDGVKAVRDGLIIGAITYLICEAGDNSINEAILKANTIGGFLGIVDYGARLLERYFSDQNFSYISKP